MFKDKLNIPIEKLYPILIYIFVTGKAPSKETYEDRLLWQKIGYIAQQLGASLDEYKFKWYLAGPYSPGYTSILYDFTNNIEDVFEYRLNNYIENKLLPMKVIIESKPREMSAPKWFELVASILYIYKNNHNFDKEAVFKSLVRKKPFFNDIKLNSMAWDLLKKLDML